MLAAGVTAALILSNTAFASDMYATRGEVADMLLHAADDYNKDVKYTDIIKGYGGDGDLREDQNVNRAEALVMLRRAFGTLPELTGHNARVALRLSARIAAQNSHRTAAAVGIVHPLEGFVGVITDILMDKQKIRAKVSMFGRDTDVELEFNQVEALV